MTASPIGADTLLAMARDRSTERRGELAMALVDLFRDGASVLSDRERAMMTDILRQLVKDVETAIRKSVAERLAEVPGAPRSLMKDLANDEIEIAWPVLRSSAVLEDVDLVEVIQQRTQEHRLAIAQRGDLSEAVSTALLKAAEGETDVVVSLLRNQNARLSRAAMEYLTEEAKRVNSFQEPLLSRHELPEDLARRLFTYVSAALRTHIVSRYDLPAETVDDLLEETVAAELTRPLPKDTRRAMALVEEMERNGMVGPPLLLKAVQAGHVMVFGRVMEKLAGISHRMALRILFESAGEGLAVLCRGLDVAKPEFIEIYTVARKSRPHNPESVRKEGRRLMSLYDAITKDAALKVMKRWKRDEDYLSALRDLEISGGGHG